MPIMHDHARNDDTAIPELTPIVDHEVAIIEVGALPIRVDARGRVHLASP
jgi:hypothetical protein